jgi:hypothetical protein
VNPNFYAFTRKNNKESYIMQRTIKSRALSLLMAFALISTLFAGLTFSASAAVGVYTVTFSSDGNETVQVGGVTVTSAQTDATGSLSFTTTPATGYAVYGVTSNLSTATITRTAANSYTISNVEANNTVSLAAAISITGGNTISTAGNYTVVGTSTGAITINTGLSGVTLYGTGVTSGDAIAGITVSVATGVPLTIGNLYISSPYSGGAILDFTGTGNTLDFTGTSLLESNGNSNGAVIHVRQGSALTIGTNSAGQNLYIYKSSSSAAIGGSTGEAAGTLTFVNGNIFAKGSQTGAVIGGDSTTAPNDPFYFNGGNINLAAVARGAAIGGSNQGQAGPVTLTNGNLAITCDFSGAAIGYGASGSVGGALTINGGSLEIALTSNSTLTPATAINATINGGASVYPFIYAPGGGTHTVTYSGSPTTPFYSGEVNTWGYTANTGSTIANWTADTNESIYLYIPSTTTSVTIDGVATPIYAVAFSYGFPSPNVFVDQYNPNGTVLSANPLTFTVDPETAIPVATGGTLTSLGSGAYNLSGLTSAGATVTVSPVTTYPVTFTATNATVYVNDAVAATANIAQGGTLTLVIVPSAGYAVALADIVASGGTVTANADGSYTLSGVSAAATVTVTAKTDSNAWNPVNTSQIDTSWYTNGSSPYSIATPQQLAGLAAIVNGTASGITQYSFAGDTVNLSADIALSNYEWTPIGGAAAPTAAGLPTGYYFAGIFDGRTNTVSGLSVTSVTPGYGGYGLFGYVSGGTIQNLTVADAGTGLTGIRTGASADFVAGVVGYISNGSITNVINKASVVVDGPNTDTTGGVAGVINNISTVSPVVPITVQYSVNTAPITGRSRLGGLVGAVYTAQTGGVVVDQSFNSGAITGINSAGRAYVGGLVGYDQGVIQNSYNTGDVSVGSGKVYAGGIAGLLNGDAVPYASITDSYNSGFVSGGLVNEPLYAYADNSANVTIENAVYIGPPAQDVLGADWTTGTVNQVTASQLTTSYVIGGNYLSSTYFTSNGRYPLFTTQTITATGSATTDLDAAIANLTGWVNTIIVPGTVNVTGTYTLDIGLNAGGVVRASSVVGDTFDVASGGTFTLTSGTIGGGAGAGSGVGVVGTFTQNGGSIIGNNAATNGGGVNLNASGTFAQNGGSISGNTAPNFGGGIYIASNSVTLSGGRVAYNSAASGGGVYVDGGNLSLASSEVVAYNNATSSGGGVYYSGGTLSFASGSVTGNTASVNGGGIFVSAGTLTTSTNASITNNYAATNGGGVYVAGGTFTQNGGNINGNGSVVVSGVPQYTQAGGGVYLAAAGAFNLNGGTISGNTATTAGGGIYVTASGTLTLTPSGADAITFGAADAIYLPASVTFNIGADLGTGVVGSVPLAFASPAVDADVAYVNDATYAATSAAKLVSGTIVFDADGTAIYIAALQKQI